MSRVCSVFRSFCIHAVSCSFVYMHFIGFTKASPGVYCFCHFCHFFLWFLSMVCLEIVVSKPVF